MTPQEKLAKAKDLLIEAQGLIREVHALGMDGVGRKPALVVDCMDSATDAIGSAIADINETVEQAL